jgi:hypothetical protein
MTWEGDKDIMKHLVTYSALVLLMISPGQVFCQRASTLHLDIKDRHPMSVIAQRIELATGVPISYEEAPIENAADLEDIAKRSVDPEFLKAHPSHRLLSPSEVRVVGDLDTGQGDPRDRAAAALKAVQKLPGLANYAMKFDIIQAGTQLVVVPTEHKDTGGVFIPSTRILDQFMSYEDTTSPTLERTLTYLVRAISKAAGVEIGIGDIPINEMMRLHTTVSARNVSARSLLYMALDNAQYSPGNRGPRFTWRLIYVPTTHSYFLHFLIAAKSVPAPFGGSVNVPMMHDKDN